MLPWKLRKRQLLPVNQNLSSVYISLAKFQLVNWNLSLAMICQMTCTQTAKTVFSHLKLLSERAFVVRFKVTRGTGSVWCRSALWDCYSGLIFTQFLAKQRRATIGPFIRGKIRRVLHRTRLK